MSEENHFQTNNKTKQNEKVLVLSYYFIPTALSYQWYKDDIRNFIRPELNTYFFISTNGHLYLSEVQDTDRGNYFCVVTLIPRVGEKLTVLQSLSRTSKAIELRVDGSRK